MASLFKKISKRPARDTNTAVICIPDDSPQPQPSSSAKQTTSKDDPIILDEPSGNSAAVKHCTKCKKQRTTSSGGFAVRCGCEESGKAPNKVAEARKPAHVPPPVKATATASATKPKRKPELRSKRLMKEYQEIMQRTDKSLFTVELVDGNLFEWNISLHKVDKDSTLHQDMVQQNIKRILLNISFPDNFPFSPPFMRVVHPRVLGGFVLDGGAICMELLTPEGWSSAYQVEAIVLQFAALVVKGNGRLPPKDKGNFAKKDALYAFKHVVKTHQKYGWVTPPTSEG